MKSVFSWLPLACFCFLAFTGCRDTRVHDHPEFSGIFEKHGVKEGCIIIKDQAHETVHLYNKERCLKRFSPASTFKIFNSLVALETAIVTDDQYVIPWNGTPYRDVCDTALTMRKAFELSCVPYYQQLAREIGPVAMQKYLDTVQYGNMKIGPAIDQFWLDGSLQISADEQLGFLKRLYFDELPFTDRTQRIVRSMMLREETDTYKLYYKTGTGTDSAGKNVLWIVGWSEMIEHVNEHENSMNKSDVRNYPYIFALNYEVPEATEAVLADRVNLLKDLLRQRQAMVPE